LLVVFACAALPVLTAQTTPAGLVLVPVRVLDSKNVPVTTLTQENFQVLEENKEQKIVQFSSASEPLTLGVVFGMSERGPVKSAGQRDRISVDILTAIDKVREANPTGTVTQNPFDSDGMFSSMAKGMEALRNQPGAKKALVVISDGLNASGSQGSSVPQPNALIDAAKVSPFPVFFLYPVLNLPAPAFTEGSNYATGYYLEQIADYSGGEMITGQIENDLGKASIALRDSLKNMYVLGYQSANTAKDGKWRKLTVKVTPPAGMKVKFEAKKRYFVPKG
jgi:Ca-activated chloride channel family protein